MNHKITWNANAQSLWQSGHRADAIDCVVQALNRCDSPKPKVLFMQFSYYLFLLGDYAASAKVFEEALNFYPDDTEIRSNLVVSYSRQGDYKQAIMQGEQLLTQDQDNIVVWDSLARSYAKTQQWDKAVAAGNRSLHIKDLQYTKNTPDWTLPESRIDTFTAQKKQVIAFSLWGSQERYINGAIRNLLLRHDFYPDWEIWIYLDDSVPQKLCDTFTQLGAVLHKQTAQAKQAIHTTQTTQHSQHTEKQKLCWRFQVANHPEVGRFLVRDIDSVFSLRERLAVEEWLQSDKWFHTLHDWWTHTDLMLAGLWGGVANVLPDVRQMVDDYQAASLATPNIDQWFLRDCLWSYVKQSCLMHDRLFRQHKLNLIQTSPIPGPAPVGNQHIGSCEFFQIPEQQRQLVAAWL